MWFLLLGSLLLFTWRYGTSAGLHLPSKWTRLPSFLMLLALAKPFVSNLF